MQSAAPLRLTQMPPRPTCSPSAFSGADCQDRWHIYNQAAHQVAAPLQQQIEDLNKLTTDQQAQIKKLSDQIEADSVVAFRLSSTTPLPSEQRLRRTPKAWSKAPESASELC